MATGARHTTFSILGSDVVVTGNVSATVDLHVDGKIEGDLKCANLVQGEASEIKGAVVAETAKIAGLVDGSIEAKTLVVHASARITGDVAYENITIETGGKVDGKLSHRRHGAGAAKAPPPLEVVENKAMSQGL
ncbi:MAG: polymer-forming cytoskeletal protein [Sphingopyxis sp.]|uniref:bactofilin family protein n=1 Tax=Sphingopyxis sp. TaxID=1908224 RepID=UPI002ABB70D8|nr:polymer-forming cytoskeletal protein [Sphingopyxis sp.]MDZ3830567.1 polymer-forming cytoskeletal protein [Sphingopyxis sp.]